MNRIEAMRRRLPLPLLAWMLAACNGQQGPRDIREVEIQPRRSGGTMPMDAVHGFGGGNGNAGAGDAPGMAVENAEGQGSGLEFDAPEGWAYEPGTGMRAATFKIQDASGVKEATVVILPSAGDGYAANIRRWLGQLGLTLDGKPLEEFIASRVEFSTAQGLRGAFFDFTRLKETMDAGKGSMLASMIETEGRTLFVKLMGGAEFLHGNRDKFLSLSRSIRLHAETPAEPSTPADRGGPETPNAMNAAPANMGMASTDPAFNRVVEGVAKITWKTPDGWKSLPPSGMRTGSFAVTSEGKTADGSIVQLSGPAGGMESNVRRWMEQVGVTQPDDAGLRAFLQAQRKFRTRDGFEGILVNLASQLNADLVQENSILAAVVHAPGETIFVKLTGPRTVLLKNLDALEQLSASLAVVK